MPDLQDDGYGQELRHVLQCRFTRRRERIDLVEDQGGRVGHHVPTVATEVRGESFGIAFSVRVAMARLTRHAMSLQEPTDGEEAISEKLGQLTKDIESTLRDLQD